MDTIKIDSIERIDVDTLKSLLDTHKSITVVDVREDPGDLIIKGALCIPLKDAEEGTTQLHLTDLVVTYCT